ncbi:hypothetical protein L1049_006972 [Liquidambar formosana]|uniref:Uncharacterized protein n=1 Tax=Liquidambar formosana TaxID=63359 RepID=A0AAP0RGC8_LIQFO
MFEFPARNYLLKHCQMYKLFSITHVYLLKNQLKNPTFLSPISHLHNGTETLAPDSKLGFILNEVEELQSSKPMKEGIQLPIPNGRIVPSEWI